MKIVCDSCSAKYSIADEKVAGRVFKIRCKKCGAAIVVRGDQVDNAAEGEDANRVVDYGGDAVWHIVIDGDQQGPFAPAQIGEMLSVGTIGWDAYVWKEGFDDWKPAQDIEELVSAVMGGDEGGGAGESEAPAAAAPAAADPFAATAGASDGLFGGADDAAVGGRDAGADLFAQSDAASPFGGGGDDEDDGLVASAANPRVSADQALTGARNENSVLFSLSNLQALATGGSEGASASSSSAPAASPSAQPRAGMAAGEGSGLIDIRALASATGMMGGGAPTGPVTSASDDKVDDLLSIGGSGAAGLGSSLGAPVLVPEAPEESSNKGIIIGGAIAAIGLLAAAVLVLAFVLMSDDDEPTAVAASGAVPPGQVVATGAPTPAAGAEGAGAAPAGGAAVAEPATPEPAAAPAAEEPESGSETEEGSDSAAGSGSSGSSGSSSGSRSRRGSRGGRSAPAAATPASPATPAASSGSRGSSRRGGGSSDIDDLLNGALGGGGGSSASSGRRGSGSSGSSGSSGGGSGPQTPSRGSVVSAMQSVSGPVRACANGTHGTATVRVVFGGSNGRVSGATVNAPSLPGPVRSCIARAVRGARVPPFRQSSFSVNYPFRL
ncbi:MAG: GYF domain-containing protein [Sandaracinaceae bacterium]